MARRRLANLLPLACVPIVALSVAAHAQVSRNCSLPMNRLLPECLQRGSSGSSGTPSAQQTIDAINRNTAEQQRRLNESFDRLRDVVKKSSESTSSGGSNCGLNGGGIPIGAGLDCLNREYEASRRTSPDSDAVDRGQRDAEDLLRRFDLQRDQAESATESDERRIGRQREREAADIIEEAKRLSQPAPTTQDCIAAMSTYRSGPQRDLPPGCLSEIERMSVYRGGSSPSAARTGGWTADEIIDGTSIPPVIDFSRSPSAAIERVFEGPSPPAPASAPQPPSGTSSDLDHAPNTPSTTLTPVYDSTPPLAPPGWSRPGAGRPLSPGMSDDDVSMSTLEILPTFPREPTWVEIWLDKFYEKTGWGPAKPGPMRRPGAPDDTLSNHQADMDRATDGWRMLNPLKYPLEVQRVFNDKADRVQIPAPPDDK